MDLCKILKHVLQGRTRYKDWKISIREDRRGALYMVLEKNGIKYKYNLAEIVKTCMQNIPVRSKTMKHIPVPLSIYSKLNVSPEYLNIRAYQDMETKEITVVLTIGQSMHFLDLDEEEFKEFLENPEEVLKKHGLMDEIEMVQGIGVFIEQVRPEEEEAVGIDKLRELIMRMG